MQTNTSDNKINTAIPHHHGMELNQMNATQINTLMEKHFDSLSKEEISLATELLDDPQVPSLENFKSQARLLQHLSGNHIKLSHALDILSQEYGKRDWRTLKTTLGSGNIAEGTGTDRFLFRKVLPALYTWRKENPGKGIVYVKGDPLNKIHIFKIFSLMMKRSSMESFYIYSVEELLREHSILFKGYRLSNYDAYRQKVENWTDEVDFIDLIIKKSYPIDIRTPLNRLFVAGNESQEMHKKVKGDYLNTMERYAAKGYTQDSLLALVSEGDLYAVPASLLVIKGYTREYLTDIILEGDVEIMRNLGIEFRRKMSSEEMSTIST